MTWVRRVVEVAVLVAFVTLIATNLMQQRQIKGLRAGLAFARRAHAGRVFETGEPFEGIGLVAHPDSKSSLMSIFPGE